MQYLSFCDWLISLSTMSIRTAFKKKEMLQSVTIGMNPERLVIKTRKKKGSLWHIWAIKPQGARQKLSYQNIRMILERNHHPHSPRPELFLWGGWMVANGLQLHRRKDTGALPPGVRGNTFPQLVLVTSPTFLPQMQPLPPNENQLLRKGCLYFVFFFFLLFLGLLPWHMEFPRLGV